MAATKQQIVLVVIAAVIAFYFYPETSQNVLQDDLLVALNNSHLNESDVITGLLASGVQNRHDVVRLKKEIAWWFLENNPARSDAITKLCKSTKAALEFEGWLVSRGIPVDVCLVCLHQHGIHNAEDFANTTASQWRHLFLDMQAHNPSCEVLVDLVKQERPHVFEEEELLVFEAERAYSISLASMFFSLFLWLWSFFFYGCAYLLLATAWAAIVLVTAWGLRKQQRRSAVELAKFTAATFFVAFLPFFLPLSLCDIISKAIFKRSIRLRRQREERRAQPERQQAAVPQPADQGPSLFSSSFFTGNYLDANKCQIEWSGVGQDCHEYAVGTTVTFTVKAFCRNGSTFALKSVNDVSITLVVNQHAVPFSKALPAQRLPSVVDDDPSTADDSTTGAAGAASSKTMSAETTGNSVVVTFFSRIAGHYQLDVRINGKSMPPAIKIFAPGPPDAGHSSLKSVRGCMAIAANSYRHLDVQLCDIYGNSCINVDKSKLKLDVCVADLQEGAAEQDAPAHNYLVESQPSPGVYEILYNVSAPGLYAAKVLFDGKLLQDGAFSLISLTEADLQQVRENVENKHLNEWYEARMYKSGGRKDTFTTVYIYLLPKQVCIKEFYVYIIPRKLCAFRIRPSTKMVCSPAPGSGSASASAASSTPCFSISDAWQGPIQLLCKKRNIVMATFAELLSRSLGGGESFEQKRTQFNASLRQEHADFSSQTVNITIKRRDLLDSAKGALTHFKNGWKKKWRVEFEGEEGLDYGGVSREFYHLISSRLFDVNTGLFRRFNVEDSQGLVHPNPKRPGNLKTDYYKFAGRIVGRCLLESSRGNAMMIKAHFTRSFLAQIIGMRLNHTYFQTDDPELFTSKVQYTLRNDVSDLEMVFAEDEYSADNTVKTIALEPGGENKPVTNENKLLYLNMLADYRLGRTVKDEVEAFMKGLNELVPDTLLGMFDENELELLMCGAGNISFNDLREHCKLTSRQVWFVEKVIPWFWVVVSSFTQEELARLVQFTTGSSQLPPDGFSELKPQFQISPAPVHGSLPTSHTCFNQLCLPDYSSCEDLQRALAIAINEGSEGFGLI
ncbi:apoptosis-resistant E3 ubiquitin protein ligase 1-like isoform X1 [Sycon ciliatum]|uniref:apoptosis-resistant E3 ubiquitin protein ligase 1-like isoform X1 n=1 Tax=Sycon ciliatum TaxID=27933 RepID=UPI0031F69E5F